MYEFKEFYRRQVERAGPTQAQLARVVERLEREEKGAGKMSKRKRVVSTVLAAALLTAALSIAALAASPTLRQSLESFLGSFAPYSREVEGVSATDQGIEIKVVSALTDEVDGTAYLEVTDKTGDRLGEDTVLRLNVSAMARHGLEPIAYDRESKTALYAVDLDTAINEIHMGRAENLELVCNSIYPGRVELPCEKREKLLDGTEYVWEQGTDIPKSLYTARTLQTRPMTEKEKEGYSSHYWDIPVPLPNQTPADLGSDYFSLSSLGFDENGSLHIQLALAEGVYLANAYGLDVDICPGYWLSDLRLSNGITCRCLLLEGGRYVDVTYVEITPDMVDRLPDATVTGVVYTEPPIEGTWELSFPYEVLPGKELTLDRPFCVEGVTLEGVRLTATRLQLTLTGDKKGVFFGGLPLHVYCRDGSVLKLDGFDQVPFYQNGAGELADEYALTYEQKAEGAGGWRRYGERDSWAYPRAVSPENVIGFSWGLFYVSLEPDTLGQARWLDKYPG